MSFPFFRQFVILGLGAMLLAPALVSAKDARISFRKGAVQAEVVGTLPGLGVQRCYLANARAGQHMRIEIVGDGATRGTLRFPSGQGDGQPGGLIYDDVLSETGDYRICVEESQMADPWAGKFVLKLYIK